MREPHAVIGIIIWVLVMLQPIFGLLHHRQYKQIQRRGLHSHAHIWLGRFLITLGILNGGLGFLLANYAGPGAIAYGVLAGLVWLLYVFILMVKRDRPTSPHRAPAGPPLRSQDQKQEYYGEKSGRINS
jgi:hypothetical protein